MVGLIRLVDTASLIDGYVVPVIVWIKYFRFRTPALAQSTIIVRVRSPAVVSHLIPGFGSVPILHAIHHRVFWYISVITHTPTQAPLVSMLYTDNPFLPTLHVVSLSMRIILTNRSLT